MNLLVDSPVYDKKNPFPALLTNRYTLSKKDSKKDTQHFEIDITGSHYSYTCGDSLGVYAQNDAQEINTLLEALKLSKTESILLPKKEETVALADALLSHLCFKQPSVKNLQFIQEYVSSNSDKQKLENWLAEEKLEETKEYLKTIEWIDLVEIFSSLTLSAQDFTSQLKRLMPRLYSIASSPTLSPNNIHLTIGIIKYATHGRPRKGIASTYLAERAELNKSKIPCFIAKSHFQLPEDPAIDMIMVGPGTGVAPFRSFIQERSTQKASGRSWLFFGDQHKATDFLYEEELTTHLDKSELTRLDLAFSRDQEHKIYVQHKMKENAAEIWNWIKNGAHFYVCGDSKHMAPDVEAALLCIFQEQGKMSLEEATTFAKDLKKSKRYQKDVY